MDSNHRYPAKFFWLPRRNFASSDKAERDLGQSDSGRPNLPPIKKACSDYRGPSPEFKSVRFQSLTEPAHRSELTVMATGLSTQIFVVRSLSTYRI